MISVRAIGVLPTTSASAGVAVSGALKPVFDGARLAAAFLATFLGAAFLGAAFLAAAFFATFLTAAFFFGQGEGFAAFFFFVGMF